MADQTITEVKTPNAPAPLPVFSQAVKANGMVFVSGNIGLDPITWKLVEGGIVAQTVSFPPLPFYPPSPLSHIIQPFIQNNSYVLKMGRIRR